MILARITMRFAEGPAVGLLEKAVARAKDESAKEKNGQLSLGELLYLAVVGHEPAQYKSAR